MRILLVEDEAPLRETLSARLKREGFAVDAAADGEEGLYHGRELPFDVGVIDLGLPKMSGMDLVRTLRSEGKKFPILILTARSSWQDKVEGLVVAGNGRTYAVTDNATLRLNVNNLFDKKYVGGLSAGAIYGAPRNACDGRAHELERPVQIDLRVVPSSSWYGPCSLPSLQDDPPLRRENRGDDRQQDRAGHRAREQQRGHRGNHEIVEHEQHAGGHTRIVAMTAVLSAAIVSNSTPSGSMSIPSSSH